MKITQSQLRRIIKEELGQMTQAKPAMRNLKKVPPQKLKGGGSVRGMLEYPKKGFIDIGPLRLKFWMSDGSHDLMVNWIDTAGDMGEGNDHINDLDSIFEEALESYIAESRQMLDDEIHIAFEAFGLD